MGQQEGGFLEATERAGESTGSIRPEVNKLEEEDAFKIHDQKIEVQKKMKVSKQDEKTKVKKAGEPNE